MKIVRSIIRMMIIFAIMIVIYLCGVYSTKYQQNVEDEKSTVSTIAVVNADAGTVIEDEKVYYSVGLMSFPDTNFEMASLTEAREGLASDRYAAYVLIPKDFSVSIQSVNHKPEKSQVTYEVNSNLRQDVQVKVVNDIHNFIVTLSSNVSYMYVDAILKEIHAVQNDSGTILENDTADMEAINAVQSAELIEAVEYEPLETIETDIEYLDLSDDYKEVDDAVAGINTTYTTNMETAAAAFLLIKENGINVDNQAVATAEAFAAVDILTDDEKNLVYQTGIDNLSSLA